MTTAYQPNPAASRQIQQSISGTLRDIDSDDIEPPLPPGLADLAGSLQSLAAFLHVDDDLLSVAAQVSPSLHAGSPTEAELARHLGAPARDGETAGQRVDTLPRNETEGVRRRSTTRPSRS